jgi:hypothetical protein
METTIEEEKAIGVKDKPKGKRTFWRSFLNFLLYGGFLVIVFVIIGIAVLIAVLTK